MKKVMQRSTLRRLTSLVLASALLIFEFESIPPKKIEESLRQEVIDTKPLNILNRLDLSRLYSCKDDPNKDTTLNLSVEDAELLMKLARSEAGDSGEDAQLIVMNVVINRLHDEMFPNSIRDIVYASKQFSVVTNGQLKKADVNVDTHMALARLEMGEDISSGALYFESSTNSSESWHSTNREYLFERYGQRFYK